MKKIAIIGSGGLGREILGIIQAINKKNKTWTFIGFYDDNYSDKLIHSYPIIGDIATLNSIEEDIYIVIGIGNPAVKEKIFKKITNPKIVFPTLIHPSVISYSEETISLGKGVVIAANCVLTVDIEISDFVYLNTACTISHDTIIEDYTMVMPTVSISGGAKIGKKVYLGNGTKIDYHITIADNTVIKAGTIFSK
ncbi:acetyltransferase [Tenacibaculum piscium]|uniref:Acetyltransferase n=1 Tax=Tenacibaculum piscium TaxID=1458515 RepID=A0A2H1YFL7_9FLAO|nr:acetyltransferase [Tenacibaculum piscium]MBE7629131.1 acetyltransferase [Tenacibaculum piscium]MBE7670574.1 acetyltransferase [Tenacibaculum piscium]MBE7684846.1 acetyltransferase [Tenacibaculum piscium]MBE7689549.1 acetyltransferase [Tenacibaculum piscium]MCG8183415.1 acetyltransferase [Tenacibaculum piscium]